MEILNVFELYSGLGGMHFALRESQLETKVVRAVDINPVANSVYKFNFPDVVLLGKNILGLLPEDFTKLGIKMITMSPPCQPFTRNGLRKDLEDTRNVSILHIINLIPKLDTVNYILLENVQGFESSNVRQSLINVLEESQFTYQEFLLSPDQFAIPNSRLRYYLLAKKTPLEFCFDRRNEIMHNLPDLKSGAAEKVTRMNLKYKMLAEDEACFKVRNIVKDDGGELLPENVLEKYGGVLDIVTGNSVRTCCFTRSYGRYVEGTGSVYSPLSHDEVENILKGLEQYDKGTKNYVELMKSLKLRYFSPEEVSRLMCFPQSFKFPCDLSLKQKYKLLGNSINIHVVAILATILIS